MFDRLPLALVAPVALALAACSGASAQLVDLAPGDAGSASSNAGPSNGNGGSDSNTDDASANGSGNGNGNGNGNGSGNGNGNGNDPGPAPAQCPPGGMSQTTGSGDMQSDATPFDTIACGTLAAGQSYWWTFTLPASTSQFGLSFTGGMQIELTLDGTTVNVVPGASLPFRTKDPYYVQLTPLGSDTESYVFIVTEQ